MTLLHINKYDFRNIDDDGDDDNKKDCSDCYHILGGDYSQWYSQCL